MEFNVTEQRAQRHLAACLAADVADYSHLLNEDEAGKEAAWQAACCDAADPAPEAHGGRVIQYTSEGFLADSATFEAAGTAALCRVPDAAEAHTDD